MIANMDLVLENISFTNQHSHQILFKSKRFVSKMLHFKKQEMFDLNFLCCKKSHILNISECRNFSNIIIFWTD